MTRKEALTDRECPLGEDCDLTVAWMAGREELRQSYRARLEEASTREGLARYEADQLRQRAEFAENRCHDLLMALNEVRGLVIDHHPDARAEQIAWARGTLASPAGMPDAQLAHACRCLLALSRDGHDHTLAREMLALIEGGLAQ